MVIVFFRLLRVSRPAPEDGSPAAAQPGLHAARLEKSSAGVDPACDPSCGERGADALRLRNAWMLRHSPSPSLKPRRVVLPSPLSLSLLYALAPPAEMCFRGAIGSAFGC